MSRRRTVRAVALFLGTFVASSGALLAVATATGSGWRAAATLPPLRPSSPDATPAEEASRTVTRVSVLIPASPADPASRPAQAWIVQPVAALASSAGSPGVVLIPGAGPASRDRLLPEAYALAAAGVTALAYDKRTAGYSLLSRDYRALADDAVGAADLLRGHPGVDPDRVGLMGWSEGGWVAPTAADRARHRIAFVALSSAPIVSPVEQVSWVARRSLVVSPAWLEKTAATAVGSGRWVLPYLEYDVRPALARLEVPVWAAWGAADPIVPVNEAARTVLRHVRESASIHIVAEGGHDLPVASGYLQQAASWMHAPTAAPASPVSGAEPESALGVGRLPALRWSSHPLLHLALALAAAATVAALSRRAARS